MINYLVTYYLAINIITFAVWGFDKFRSKYNQWRVPEKTLYGLILLGGGIGALAGMVVFRHKTRKPHFRILCIFGLVVHFLLFIYLIQG
ncbi:MAG TPA: DUF1294 domain-containing protein [Anaerolineaceae bacterium]|nr:DUF1294 domain-containing protein [Anaerolineaceae bacterium]